MKRFKVIVLAPAAAVVMLVGLAGPAAAGGKVGVDPGRGNSTDGLVNAMTKQTTVGGNRQAHRADQPELHQGAGSQSARRRHPGWRRRLYSRDVLTNLNRLSGRYGQSSEPTNLTIRCISG